MNQQDSSAVMPSAVSLAYVPKIEGQCHPGFIPHHLQGLQSQEKEHVPMRHFPQKGRREEKEQDAFVCCFSTYST